MLTGIVVLSSLAGAMSIVLVIVNRMLEYDDDTIVEQIEALLPRIECAQCGFPGCRAYAEAIASEQAAINLCPPGGDATVARLADLLGTSTAPVDTTHGNASLERVAKIDEALCIGCNLCLQACPVDAIAGVPQMMHTVLMQCCTGCELCVSPCPVDCIELVPRDA